MVDYRLRELGFKRIGIALPPKPKNAILVPDPTPNCNDPNHIFTRMKERNMSEDDLKSFMSNAKVMFSQWNGQRQTFRSEYGAVVLTKFQDDWIYKTAWTKMQFNEDELKILEVIRKYV